MSAWMVDGFLGLVLVIAVVADIRTRRIPNKLILTGLLVGFTVALVNNGWFGLMFSLEGLLLGVGLLLVPYLMGGMGAGDVKLLGMVGAVKGPAFVLSAFVWMALFGGVFAVVMLVAEGQLKQTLKRLWTGILLALGMGRFSVVSQSVGTEPFRVFVPYGVAIAVGSAAACIKGWW